MLVIVRADLATMTPPPPPERLRDGLLLPLSRPSSRNHPDRLGLYSTAVRRELPRGRGRGGGVGRRGHVALRAASVAGARRQTHRARAGALRDDHPRAPRSLVRRRLPAATPAQRAIGGAPARRRAYDRSGQADRRRECATN